MMAEPDMLAEHCANLCRAFVDSCRETGGPESITFDAVWECARLNLAKMSPNVGGNAMQLLKQTPKAEWASIPSVYDPRVMNAFLPRNYVRAMHTNLSIWKSLRLYENFKRWRDQSKWIPKKDP